MTVTYGERILLRAEARSRARAARRRRLTLLAPAWIATVWAAADLIGARQARLSALGAGGMRLVVDHAEVIVWTVAFVMVPLAIALRPRPFASGAALAFLAGPIASPLLFGPGGWSWWQSGVLAVVAFVVLSAAKQRRTARR